MIKVVCIKKCSPFLGDDGEELIQYKSYYITEKNWDDKTNCPLWGIYDGLDVFDYIGAYEPENFITVQEWRELVINKLLEND